MHVEPVTTQNVARFREYYLGHAAEHDTSDLPEGKFSPGPDNPSWLLLEDGVVIGAASVMRMGFEQIKRARFRILHCTEPNEEWYRMLVEVVRQALPSDHTAFAFIPEHQTLTRQVWESLGFQVERYAWIMERDTQDVTPANFPDGYVIETITKADAEVYAEILNKSFVKELGRFEKTKEDILRRLTDHEHPVQLHLLKHQGTAVGVLATSEEADDGKSLLVIETLGLLPDYQGRRLGRQLLRAGCQRSRERPFDKIVLSVQAQNERAAELYLEEGFRKSGTMVCYALRLGEP